MAKRMAVVVWVASGLLAALFLMAGGMKLSGTQEAVQTFTRYGYPQWFRILIGVTEASGAVLLLIPRAAVYSATALGVVMIGAAYTHVMNSEASHAPLPIVLLVVLAFIGYARRTTP